MAVDSSSCGSPTFVVQPVSVLDVSDVLHSRFVLLTGGIARDGCPLITFPDVEVDAQSISDDDYKKIMAFLSGIPTLSDADIGYVVIIDKRKDKWNSVKTLLLKISAHFPGHVREVLVLRPDGFFQRTFKEVSSKWLHENFRFDVILLQSLEELQKKVDPSHLTTDLGGTFMFDPKEWVQHRFAIESYGRHCLELAERLRVLSSSLDEAEMPNDVTATEELIAEHTRLKEEVVDEIMDARNQGDMLLSCLRRKSRPLISADSSAQKSPSGESLPGCSAPSSPVLSHDRLMHIASTERLMVQLGEANSCFNKFWERHQKRLDSCLKLRRFEESFKEMQFRLEQVVRTAVELPRCGGSPAELEVLLADLKTVEADSEGHVARAERLRIDGIDLAGQPSLAGSNSSSRASYCGSTEDIAYSVLPKCAELERMCAQYRASITERRDTILRSADLHRKIEQLKKWCSSGLDLLADGLEVRLGSVEALQAGLQQLDAFLRSGSAFNFNNPAEFRKIYDDVMCAATKERVQDALLRASDVQELCSRRRVALQEAVAAANAAAANSATSRSQFSAPGQSPSLTKKRLSISVGISTADFRSRAEALHGAITKQLAKQSLLPPLQSAPGATVSSAGGTTAVTVDLNAGGGGSISSSLSPRSAAMDSGSSSSSNQRTPEHKQHSRKRSFSLKGGIKGIFLGRRKRDGEDDEEPEPLPVLTADDDDDKCATTDISEKAAATDGSTASRDSTQRATASAMRSSVMSELVETEKVYVNELREVVQGYVKAVNDPSLSHLLPEQLLPGGSGCNLLFGNIEKVLAFHADVFLEELLTCRHSPSNVSRCFLARLEEFRVYLDYCQNKPNSDKLLQEIGDGNPFFKECQQQLGHLLPLGSYLLKPVQRITKYQLLLREMLHYTEESEAESEETVSDLRRALSSMLDLLKHANDLMHHLAITGYQSTTPTGSDRGKLLMQGPLTVSVSRRKDRMPTFRLRTANRHAFLYEKVLLFCKPKEDASGQLIRSGSFRDHYRYKSSIIMSAVDTAAEDAREPRRLELRLRGVGGALYSLQAPTATARDEWLRELRRALLLLVDEAVTPDGSATATEIHPSSRTATTTADVQAPSSPSATSPARVLSPKACRVATAKQGPTCGAETDEGWSSGDETHSDGDPTASDGDRRNSSDCGKARYPCLMTFTPAIREARVTCDGDDLLLSEGDVVECLGSAMAPSEDGEGGEMMICARIPGTEVKGWVPLSRLLPYAGPKPISQEESGCSISSGSSSSQD